MEEKKANVSYVFQGVILNTPLPFSAFAPGTPINPQKFKFKIDPDGEYDSPPDEPTIVEG